MNPFIIFESRARYQERLEEAAQRRLAQMARGRWLLAPAARGAASQCANRAPPARSIVFAAGQRSTCSDRGAELSAPA